MIEGLGNGPISAQHGRRPLETFRAAMSPCHDPTPAPQRARRHPLLPELPLIPFVLDCRVSQSSTFSSITASVRSMANATVINANATSKPQPATAAPIEPLKNDTARLYTHMHPLLVLSVYALKFRALVADPVPTLLSTLAPLAVLQIAFVAVCLPPTGGTPSMRKQKPGEKKGKTPTKLEQGVNSKIVVRVFSTTAAGPGACGKQ